ncbi:MAG: formate C-acetyltransferase/glycerol dehydratase family glycyl radical enzyme [Candidatus Lokiarchaeia archaeon]
MQLEQLPSSYYENRILKMKDKVVMQPHEVCIERAKLITDSYKNSKGEPPVLRFAKAIGHLLTNMSIRIWEDEFIVGNRCSKFVGTPLYPEIRVDFLEQDVDTFDKRLVQKLLISDEDKRIFKENIVPYWKTEEHTLKEQFLKNLDPQVKNIMDTLVFLVETELTNGIGHFFPGHENILKYGLNGLIKKAKSKIEEFSDNPKKKKFLQSVIIVCNAAKSFIKRFSSLARKISEKELNSKRKVELIEISEICSNISENPPKNFKEALQLVYFNHLICGLEDGGYAVSIGRLDQLLYPYYIKDIDRGIITKEDVQFLIECFFLKLTTLWNYVFYLAINAAEGPPITENVTIGGLDRKGNDATNDLSYIILDSYTYIQTVQPTFSIRIHQSTPEDFLIKIAESVKLGTSIALFNDDVMIQGLVKRGFTLEDAREYAPIGCVEPQHPSKSFGSTNACQLNIVKCLELALTNGSDMFIRRDIGVKSNKEIKSYQDLWNSFLLQMKFLIKNMVLTMNTLDKTIAEINPQPYLSSTIDNCIERGLDVTKGGAIYNFTGPQLIGLATVADSLAVIKKFVFEDNILPFEEMLTILMKNYRGSYQGKKGSEWRELFINKVPKFGNDNDYVDQIAVDIVREYCNEISKYENYRTGKFNPGVYSTSFHITFGSFTAASADGRKSRDLLSNGVGPTNGRDKNGPTAILNSVKKLNTELITNGTSLILDFHPNNLKQDIFIPLIKSFFEPNGGYHIQFNVVGKETLCKAQENPDDYRGLVVRIAGYSVLFTELTKAAQNDIIARTQY